MQLAPQLSEPDIPLGDTAAAWQTRLDVSRSPSCRPASATPQACAPSTPTATSGPDDGIQTRATVDDVFLHARHYL